MITIIKVGKTVTTLVATLIAATVAMPGTAVADAGTSGGATYTVSTTTIDLGGDWHINVGQLSNGHDAVAMVFNTASVASGTAMAEMIDRDRLVRDRASFTTTPTVSFRPTVIAQVLNGGYYHEGGAHPVDYVTTIVIDTRTAAPITLDDLFADKQAGLDRLSEQTKLIFPRKYGNGTPMPDTPSNAPASANFENWIPTAAGLELHFKEDQFGPGLMPVITVPWSELTALLAPDMKVLAQ